MLVGTFVALLTALPLIFASSSPPGYGNGGRYGFKSCTSRKPSPGKISCINFDTIKTDPKNGTADVPKDYTGLKFSSQFSVINITAVSDTIPLENKDSAVSSPNALIGSRYNPYDKKDKSPASFNVEEGSFDLFGFYIQPMASPPPGTSIFITAYSANGGDKFSYTQSFIWSTKEPIYFDTNKDAGPKLWNGLKKVQVWAEYGSDGYDWEFFIDDVWFRWGNDIKSTTDAQYIEELK